jgi:hypothetical protein
MIIKFMWMTRTLMFWVPRLAGLIAREDNWRSCRIN